MSLESNTESLQNILDTVNNLPNARLTTETVTVTVPNSDRRPLDINTMATYTNASGEIVSGAPAGVATQFTVLKGSIFFLLGHLKDISQLTSPANYGRVTNDATDQRFYSNGKHGVFFVADTDITVVY